MPALLLYPLQAVLEVLLSFGVWCLAAAPGRMHAAMVLREKVFPVEVVRRLAVAA